MSNPTFKTGRNCNVFCCVYGCNSRGKKNRELSFHLFPKKGAFRVTVCKANGTTDLIDANKAWTMALKMGKPASQFMKVCSLHFKLEDFLFGDFMRKRRVLKKGAVPSCNLPVTTLDRFRNKPEARRILKRNKPENEPVLSEECPQQLQNQQVSKEELEAAQILQTLWKHQETPRPVKGYQEATVQVNSGDFTHNFVDSLDSDQKVCSITGLTSVKLLNTLTELLSNELKLKKRQLKLNIKSRLVMTLMKMKTNLSYVVLSIIFNSVVTPTMCREIFRETIDILHYILQTCIPFLSMDVIDLHRPACFADFKNVRIILDCTEIYVQKPKCLCCNLKLYSNYYESTTIKFMVGVAPSGLISFVSRAYGGRTSDKAIFEQSDLIQKLTPGRDAVMVDKGFLIDDICNIHRIKVIRPPFLKKRSQFTDEEAHNTRKIAQARIHVERVNQRIKIFKILSSTLPSNQIPEIEKIFFIICALTNLSAPVLAENRF